MHRVLHHLLAGAAALAAFIALWSVCWRLELLVMRELYRASDRLGLLTGSAAGAMQIMGLYITRPPEWLRFIVEFTSAAIGLGVAIFTILWVDRVLAPHSLPGVTVARRLRRAFMIDAAAVLAFAVMVAFLNDPVEVRLRSWIVAAGPQSGRTFYSLSGPFLTSPHAEQWNFAWRWLPLVSTYVIALLAMLPLHRLARRWERRSRPGCCAGCGYNLRGSDSEMCPECGVRKG